MKYKNRLQNRKARRPKIIGGEVKKQSGRNEQAGGSPAIIPTGETMNELNELFICRICKREFSKDNEDWGNMCFRCVDIWNDYLESITAKRLK